MNKDLSKKQQAGLSRRAFLRGAGIAAVGVAASRRTLAEDQSRVLSFVHTHTGERLTAAYFVAGAYCEGVLAQVNQLLRDFRTETVFPIDRGVLDRLFAVQTLTGSREPFEVICGYRSPPPMPPCAGFPTGWPSTACTCRAARSTCASAASPPHA